MASYTVAYSKFLDRLKEIELLRRNAKRNSLTGRQDGPATANAICRSAIVLLTSHIEGYIEDLCEVALERIVVKEMKKTDLGNSFQYYFSKDIIRSIKATTEPELITNHVKNLICRDSDIWSNHDFYLSPLPFDKFAFDFSNPKPKFIKKFFNRFGYSTYEGDLKSKLGAGSYAICTNMIDQVVENRHKIAHGDPLTTSTPTDIQEMIRLVKLFCQRTDEVTGSWFASKGCPIR